MARWELFVSVGAGVADDGWMGPLGRPILEKRDTHVDSMHNMHIISSLVEIYPSQHKRHQVTSCDNGSSIALLLSLSLEL